MRIKNDYDIHFFRHVNELRKEDAIYYRNRIQSLIDEEPYKHAAVDMNEYEWLDSNERYHILVRVSVDDNEKEMTKADFYNKCNAARKKLDYIFDAVGLSERIES